MAIAFSCTCGKHLRARDEFAGRRIKCPGCQNLLTIPVAAEVSAPAAARAAPPPAPEPILDGEPPAVPLARPVALKVPDAVIPLAKTTPGRAEERDGSAIAMATAAVQAPLPNLWIDRSLEQTATPWRGDDRERFHHEIRLRRGFSPGLTLAAAFAVIAVIAIFLLLS
jgi:hypothetical protein